MKRVMISSTVRDLPEHRKQVQSACERLGMFHPHMMENLTAEDASALDVSLRMVDEADVYIGVFAFRYGYIPDGQSISVTEAEYDRAVARNIPRLIFLMSDQHTVKPADFERGVGGEKIEALKERLKKERVVAFFKSPDDLRAHVLQALIPYRDESKTIVHYESDITAAPEPYIAHVYTLLQTPTLIGRQMELKLLTDWITDPNGARIMSFVAIGGTGKSAVTWHWFKTIAPQEMKPLAGQMWWSFYEPDATFENFVTRALAYVTHRPLKEIQEIPAPDRESQLLAVLNREPFLIVLDGFERLQIAYARMDAARLDDSQVGGERNLRKTIDIRVGRFLRKFAQTKNSRIQISTRLYPAELETDGGDPLPGSARFDTPGLSDEDAVELWRALGVSGSRADLRSIFSTLGNHPLLIQALAGTIRRDRRAHGDFDHWRRINPQFDPIKLPGLSERIIHVMEFALADLSYTAGQVLNTLAAFHRPTNFDTLSVLLVGDENPCGNENDLTQAFDELEDRGLVGYDNRDNRYDLHPIIRGVVRNGLDGDARRGIYARFCSYFESTPIIEFEDIQSLDDLTPVLEFYYALIGMERYDDAAILFRDRLNHPTLYRLGTSLIRIELLKLLFPKGLTQPPQLSDPESHGWTLTALGLGYELSGNPASAVPLLRQNLEIRARINDESDLIPGLSNLAHSLRNVGSILQSEIFARRAVGIACRVDAIQAQSYSRYVLGLAMGVRGKHETAIRILEKSLEVFAECEDNQAEAVISGHLTHLYLMTGDFSRAESVAQRSWDRSQINRHARDLIRAALAQGTVAVETGNNITADERLHYALSGSRVVNLIEGELPALISLAELRRRQGDQKAAREFLDDIWEYAERGPYPLFHADALNVLAQIERDAGNSVAATDAATKAYQSAWCDGPPYAYHWGLIKAQKQLEELGAPLPVMPPFDESNFEPMPEVEIDPADEVQVAQQDME